MTQHLRYFALIRRQHQRGWLSLILCLATGLCLAQTTRAPSVTLTNFVSGIINGSVVIALVARERRPLLWLPLFALAIVSAVLFLPEAILSVLLVALVFSALPQVRESWESRRQRRASAVSRPSLYVAIVSLSCWGAYAVVEQRALMMLTSSLALLLNGSVLVLELTGERTVSEAAQSS